MNKKVTVVPCSIKERVTLNTILKTKFGEFYCDHIAKFTNGAVIAYNTKAEDDDVVILQTCEK